MRPSVARPARRGQFCSARCAAPSRGRGARPRASRGRARPCPCTRAPAGSSGRSRTRTRSRRSRRACRRHRRCRATAPSSVNHWNWPKLPGEFGSVMPTRDDAHRRERADEAQVEAGSIVWKPLREHPHAERRSRTSRRRSTATNTPRFAPSLSTVEAADHVEQLGLDHARRASARAAAAATASGRTRRSARGRRSANTRNTSAAANTPSAAYAVGIIQPGALGAAQREARAEHEQRDEQAVDDALDRDRAERRRCRDAALAQQAGPHELAEARRQREDRHEADRRDREQRAGRQLHADRREQVVPAQRAAQVHDRRAGRGTRARYGANVAPLQRAATRASSCVDVSWLGHTSHRHSASMPNESARLIASFMSVGQLAGEDRARCVIEQPHHRRVAELLLDPRAGRSRACWRSPTWCASVATAVARPFSRR